MKPLALILLIAGAGLWLASKSKSAAVAVVDASQDAKVDPATPQPELPDSYPDPGLHVWEEDKIPKPKIGWPFPPMNWVSEKEARQSPKPDYYHCTLAKNCPACLLMEPLLLNRAVVADSRNFDCVKVYGDDRAAFQKWARYHRYPVTAFPSDLFISADGRSYRLFTGVPRLESGGAPSGATLLLRFHQARQAFKGITIRVVPQKEVTEAKNKPTLAASPVLPVTKPRNAANGGCQACERSVATGRGYSRRVATPGLFGRATFRPSPLFR